MDTKIVHKDREGLGSVDLAEPVQILYVLPPVECLGLDRQSFDTCPLADCSANTYITCVYLFLVDTDILTFATPFLLTDA